MVVDFEIWSHSLDKGSPQEFQIKVLIYANKVNNEGKNRPRMLINYTTKETMLMNDRIP